MTMRPFLLALISVAACKTTTANFEHCTHNEGDQYCAENFPDTPLCENGAGQCTLGGRTGCVAEVSDACHDPCGELGDECAAAEDSGSGGGQESTTTDATGGEDATAESSGAPPTACGNGERDDGERCDDGPLNGDYGHCAADCSGMGPHCGDGIVNGDEDCDELDRQDQDGCNTNCVESLTPLWILPTSTAEVYDIVASPDGGLFAAGTFESAAWAQSLDADGSPLDSAIVPSATEGQIYFSGIANGPDDSLWAVATASSPTTGQLHRLFGPDSVDFEFPTGLRSIATHADGAYALGILADALGVFRFDASAGSEWILPAPDPSTCAGSSSAQGPEINGDGEALFTCQGTSGSWYIHRYTAAGTILHTEWISPPADIRAIAIDGQDDLYFVGDDTLGAYVMRYSLTTGEVWTTPNAVDGNTTTWRDIQVAPDGETLIVVGGAEIKPKIYMGAASRLSVDGGSLSVSILDGITFLWNVAIGPEGEVYVAGQLPVTKEHLLMRLAP